MKPPKLYPFFERHAGGRVGVKKGSKGVEEERRHAVKRNKAHEALVEFGVLGGSGS